MSLAVLLIHRSLVGSMPTFSAFARHQSRRFKGVGRWTAEMFLLFCLGRMDVFSAQDGGLRRATALLYGRGICPPSLDDVTEASDAWRPYRTIASLYLWRGLDIGVLR